MSHPPRPPSSDSDERWIATVRVLKRHHARLLRKRDAVAGDLAEARRAPELRRTGEALLAYLHRVPKRASKRAFASGAAALGSG